ncbi:MAG: hypothetical protein M3O15_02050 [Acidobacteriota bacterium]|nr:hypothetical protein [Acidobacteriota bacterium]
MQDLTTAYYETAFRLRFVESTGDSFQDLFSSIMEMRYSSDFVRVRPWGNVGDRKNDGYLRSKRQLFQCFAPREMTARKCLTKISGDFRSALPYWQLYFDQWIFTHNDTKGLGPDVLELLLRLSADHSPVIAMHWGYAELLAEFKALEQTKLASLLGPAPGLKDVVNVRVAAVEQFLKHIALQPEPLTSDVRPVPAAKLQHNQLSDAAGILLKAGMTRAEIVKKYLRGLSDQTRHDRVAAAFRSRYAELKRDGMTPDDIFVGLQKFVTGDSIPNPSNQAAILAILAYFFEACEIFERPPG